MSRMRRFFTQMKPETFEKIAFDFHQRDSDDKVSALIEWCSSHGFNMSDLRARYPELNNDPGIKDV